MRRGYRIPNENLGALDAKFAKLARRAAKLGVEAPTATHLAVETVETRGAIYTYTWVAVTGVAPKFAGWTLTAVIELDREEPDTPHVVHVVTGEADPAWRTLAEQCDHCHVAARGRKQLVVVTHDDGTRKIVGTTCLKDFLGHAAPDAIASWAQVVVDADDLTEFEERGPGTGEQRYDPVTFLAWTIRAIHEHGWVARSNCRFDQTPTADTALRLLQLAAGLARPDRFEELPDDLTVAELAEAAEVLAWAAELATDNDYLANLQAVAVKSSWRVKHLGFAASAVTAWERDRARAVEADARAAAGAASTFVGRPGERIEVDGTVTFVRFFDGDWGTRALVKIDADGDALTWWCSNAANAPGIGDTVTGKATVKAHETYQGVKQTVITRATLEAR